LIDLRPLFNFHPSPMRFDLPDDKLHVHTCRIPIRWGDMDPMGHVNNTVYFRYLEIARIDWLEQVAAQVTPGGVGPVIVNAFCNFHRQLSFPGDIVVQQFVRNPGRSSFDTYATIERADEPGVVYASGGARMVWIDQAAGRSLPLPGHIRALLGPTPTDAAGG
jgi:acyl-CoA thioester hydrolase